MACRIASTWTGGRQLYTSSRHSRIEGFDASASNVVGRGTAEKNRVQKVLEDANVKIGNVLTDVFGMSGQAMLEALLENRMNARTDGQPGSRTVTAKNSRHHRYVGRASDERSSPASGEPRAQTHALRRRDDQRTGSSNLRKAKTVLQTDRTRLHDTWDWTCCRGKHSGGNGNGHERRRAVC